jgi:hypothetical protein
MPINIEAVSVCVGYSDFLEVTARENRALFERWVIVTRPEDWATIECCRRNSLDCLTTTEVGLYGAPFYKGRALAMGVTQLSSYAWVLHLDADIVLPRDTLRMLDYARLDKSCIYGVDRFMVRSWKDWKALEASGYLYNQHKYHMFVAPPEDQSIAGINGRLICDRFGFAPIGFFQLYHGTEGLHVNWRWKDFSPVEDTGRYHSDVKFALHWDRQKRVLLPELFAVHLESEQLPCYGANWKGRKTIPFGPPKNLRGSKGGY